MQSDKNMSKHRKNVRANNKKWKKRENIENYKFKWRNLWCHGTLDIDNTGHQRHALTHVDTWDIFGKNPPFDTRDTRISLGSIVQHNL